MTDNTSLLLNSSPLDVHIEVYLAMQMGRAPVEFSAARSRRAAEQKVLLYLSVLALTCSSNTKDDINPYPVPFSLSLLVISDFSDLFYVIYFFLNWLYRYREFNFGLQFYKKKKLVQQSHLTYFF
jgi:hypothetical protein